MRKIGERVGAVKSADKETVYLYGYGTYEGEEIPPEPKSIFGLSFVADNRTNPKIKLDNGKVVWGFECWWGDEDVVKASIGGRKVVEVDPPED